MFEAAMVAMLPSSCCCCADDEPDLAERSSSESSPICAEDEADVDVDVFRRFSEADGLVPACLRFLLLPLLPRPPEEARGMLWFMTTSPGGILTAEASVLSFR